MATLAINEPALSPLTIGEPLTPELVRNGLHVLSITFLTGEDEMAQQARQIARNAPDDDQAALDLIRWFRVQIDATIGGRKQPATLAELWPIYAWYAIELVDWQAIARRLRQTS